MKQKTIIEQYTQSSDLEFDSMSSSKFVEKLRRQAVKNFLDILILTEIKKGAISGYDALSFIQRRFNILVSSGTVYSLLYSLERDGLIKGVWDKRKRVYELTEKGEQNIELVTRANTELQSFLTNISLLDAPNHQKPTPT